MILLINQFIILIELFTLMNRIKKDDVVAQLTRIKGDMFDNCTTYIKEEYIDLDLEIEKLKEELKEKELVFNNDLCDNTEITYDGKLNFNEIITKLSKEHTSNIMIGFILVLLLLIYITVKLLQGVKYMMCLIYSVQRRIIMILIV